MFRKMFRQLVIEPLSARRVFAAHALMFFGFPVEDAVASIAPIVGQSSTTRHREVSFPDNQNIRTIGLHPQGPVLQDSISERLTLPPEAVDVAINLVLDKDSAVGFVTGIDSETESFLWITPSRSVSLGDAFPLAGFQHHDGSTVLVLDLVDELSVVQYSPEGALLRSTPFSIDIYSSASADQNGVVLYGSSGDTPQVAVVDRDFKTTETELQLPPGSDVALVVGQSASGSTQQFVGSAIDSEGGSSIALWNQSGEYVGSVGSGDLFVVEASGATISVETPEGQRLLVRDQALADFLGIQPNAAVGIEQITQLVNFGFQDPAITSLVSRNGEIVIGINALDAQGEAVHALFVAAVHFFPSHWQNHALREDVNRDGYVSPLDALVIINELNRSSSHYLGPEHLLLNYYWDVSGNGIVSALDALIVINFLNRRAGEGEASDDESLVPFGPQELIVAAFAEEWLKQRNRRGRFL